MRVIVRVGVRVRVRVQVGVRVRVRAAGTGLSPAGVSLRRSLPPDGAIQISTPG